MANLFNKAKEKTKEAVDSASALVEEKKPSTFGVKNLGAKTSRTPEERLLRELEDWLGTVTGLELTEERYTLVLKVKKDCEALKEAIRVNKEKEIADLKAEKELNEKLAEAKGEDKAEAEEAK